MTAQLIFFTSERFLTKFPDFSTVCLLTRYGSPVDTKKKGKFCVSRINPKDMGKTAARIDFWQTIFVERDVSKNSGTPKSSSLTGFSIINHPFWEYHHFRKHPYFTFTSQYNHLNTFGIMDAEFFSNSKYCSTALHQKE